MSRTPKGHGSNVVYKRVRDRGYQVFAVDPNAGEVEGDRCHHDLKSALNAAAQELEQQSG